MIYTRVFLEKEGGQKFNRRGLRGKCEGRKQSGVMGNCFKLYCEWERKMVRSQRGMCSKGRVFFFFLKMIYIEVYIYVDGVDLVDREL